MLRFFLILFTTFCIFSSFLPAQEIPEGGESVLTEDAAVKMNFYGTSYARKTVVDVEDMPFSRAVQVETFNQPERIWDTQLSISTIKAIMEAEVLLAVFYARGVQSQQESGEVFSEFVFERDSDPWTKSSTHPVSVINEWKMYMIPFTCVEDYSAGGAAVKFRCGYEPQILQIGGLQLYNYKKSISLEDLPRTSVDYPGRDPNAPWRTLAEQMIDRNRKADIQITVLDNEGAAVGGAAVEVGMLSHDYKFGSAVVASTILQGDSDGDRYNEIIETYFNRVVFENDLKWHQWENPSRQSETIEAADYLLDMGIEIRGHTLVWPAWRYLPDDLELHKDDPDYLRQRTREHIEDEVSTMKGLVVDWDVINEPYWNHDLMDILGDEVMIEWFNIARENDENVSLYLNDNNIISGGGKDNRHQQHFYDTVEYLIDNGAPLHGLGTQCHFGDNVTAPELIWEILDELAKYDLEIQATEFDVDTDDTDLQVAYTRDFMTAYFAHPATVGILTWGFWEGRIYKPRIAFWDLDWNLYPHGEVWVDLVTREWWTDETLTTDACGGANLRGFLGDYSIEIRNGGVTVTASFEHRKGGTTIVVYGDSVAVTHEQPSNIGTPSNGKPQEFRLSQNYPNPFNPETTIEYSLDRSGRVEVTITGMTGRRVRTLVSGVLAPGSYRTLWRGKDDEGRPAASGVYLCTLRAQGGSETIKMLLLQ